MTSTHSAGIGELVKSTEGHVATSENNTVMGKEGTSTALKVGGVEESRRADA